MIELVLHFFSEGAWNAESMRVKGRGALLGPEESGPAHWTVMSWGLELVFLGHSHTGWFWCGGWLGPALTKRLVGSLVGCVVSLAGVLDHVCGGRGAGVPARILRTV